MTDAPHPALAYAEEQLGVHTVFDEANVLSSSLNELLTALDKAQDERRELDSKIDDLEMDILVEERGKHPDHSEAAFSRHLKEVYHKHSDLRMLKHQRNAKAGECSGLDLDIEYTKARIRIMTARMEELGGYFHYLAVTKQASINTPTA